MKVVAILKGRREMTSHRAAGGGNLDDRRARVRRPSCTRPTAGDTIADETRISSTPCSEQQPRSLTACILIASKDGEATIGHTIDHCRGQADVYVVSDGSTDHTAPEARRRGATVMELADNVGKPNALRMAYDGFRLGRRYDAILVLDDDTRLAPDFIDEAMKLMQPGVAVVCGETRSDWMYDLRWNGLVGSQRVRVLAVRAVPEGRPTGDQRDHGHSRVELGVPYQGDDRTPGT